MNVQTPTHRPRLRRGCAILTPPSLRRDPHRIVRVEIGYGTYAYRCTRPMPLGGLVRVHARIEGWLVLPVVGYGRQGFHGRLKRATPVAG